MTAQERLVALDNLAFFSVPDAAAFFGSDVRSFRRAIEAGQVPATKIGPKWMVPTSWLREAAGLISS